MIQNTLRRAKLTTILSLKRAWAKCWTDFSENLEKSVSVSVKIGKMYKIGMLIFQNRKSVSVYYLILKVGIGIGKVKIFKIGKNRYQ